MLVSVIRQAAEFIPSFASRYFVGVARLVLHRWNHALADGSGNQRAVVVPFDLAVQLYIEDRDRVRVDDDLAVFGRIPIMKHARDGASERYDAWVSNDYPGAGRLQIDIVEEQHALGEPASIEPDVDFSGPEVRSAVEPRRRR